MTITEQIQSRRSVRTFRDDPVKKEDELRIREIVKIASGKQDSDFPDTAGNIRILYMPPAVLTDAGQIKMGTYGFIRHPQGYLAGTCRNRREDLLAFGRKMEKLILELTTLGLGTCWLAGTFSRGNWNQVIPIPGGHILPAVIPLGYPAESARFKERLMRSITRADSRKHPEQLFFDGDFSSPLKSGSAGKWEHPMNMVRLAPSASNKQPWRLILSPDRRSCRLYLETSPGYSGSLGFPVQVLDMGIAMCHLEAAAEEAGLGGNWNFDSPLSVSLPANTEFIAEYKLS